MTIHKGLSEPLSVATPRGRFAYRTSGDPAGSPLVLLHGWPESSACWHGVAARLRPDLRVIAPDLRGLGDSTRDGERAAFQKRELAADVVAVLDALGVGEFQLAGHDWGGPTAQEVALAVEPRVRRLVLLNTPIINNARGNAHALDEIRSADGRRHWYQHFQQQRDLPEQVIPGREEAWLRYFLRTYRLEPLPDEVIAEYVRCYAIEGTPRTGANYYRAIREDHRRWASLAGHVWPMPVLYIYGRHDPVVIPAYLGGVEACCSSLRLVEIEAGHFVQEEQPEQVAELLNAWLEPPMSTPDGGSP